MRNSIVMVAQGIILSRTSCGLVVSKPLFIITIKSCWKYRFPSFPLAISPYWPSLGKSSRLHSVSTQSCKYLLTLVCPCIGVHKRMSFMSLSLFTQQCPVCLVCFTSMVCEMDGKWPYNYCFVGYCFQDLFKTAHSIFV